MTKKNDTRWKGKKHCIYGPEKLIKKHYYFLSKYSKNLVTQPTIGSKKVRESHLPVTNPNNAYPLPFQTVDLWNNIVRSFDYVFLHFLLPLPRLYCYAQKHVKSIRAVTRPGEISEKRYRSIRRPKSSKNKLKLRQLAHTASSPYHVSDHKAAITVGVIMGVFLICWVPFFCVNIIAAFCKTCIGQQTFKVLSWLGYSNSAFNPIIYSIFNTEFREAFKRILTSRSSWCCGQEMGNIYPRSSDRYVTDYAAKNVVMNSGRSSADLEQVSAIWPY